MRKNLRLFKFLFTAFLSLSILIATGLCFVNTDQGLATSNGFLVDRVIDNRSSNEPNINLTGGSDASAPELCLRNDGSNVRLDCNNSPVFTNLSNVSNASLRSQYGDYRNHIQATFFFQNRLGGNDNSKWLNSDSRWHPISDSQFTASQAGKIFAGTTLMSRVWQQRKPALLSCAAINTGFVSSMETLLSGSRYIAIGAFKQSLSPDKYAFGAFTHSRPLAVSKPPVKVFRVPFGKTQRIPIGPPITLVGLSVNVNDLDQSSVAKTASVVFHELLHNVGFGHGDNEPNSYNNRKVPILALEDCMRAEAEKLEGAVGSAPDDGKQHVTSLHETLQSSALSTSISLPIVNNQILFDKASM